MSFRDFVTGGAACAVPGQDGSSSSNPLGGLADSIIGSASKTQERIREMPGLAGPGQSGRQLGRNGPLSSLPGSEIHLGRRPEGQSSDNLRGFHGADLKEFTGARNLSVDMWPPPQLPVTHPNQEEALFSEFEGIYGQQVGSVSAPHPLHAHPQRVLNGFLSSFLDSSRTNAPFPAVRLPELGLSQVDKRQIRDRSHIIGRHIFADKGAAFVDSQVTGLLHSLDIDCLGAQNRGPLGGQLPEFEQLWKEGYAQNITQVVPRPPMPPANQWAGEFQNRFRPLGTPEGWADEFEIQQNDDPWVNQFAQQQHQFRLHNGPMDNMAGMEQTRSLVHTMSQNQDPKFQNSKFLQFVSKMSRGELIVEDNQVKPIKANTSADTWAGEFQEQHPRSWASEFTDGEHQLRSDIGPSNFARADPELVAMKDAWVDEFSRLGVKDWADEFGDQNGKDATGDGTGSEWADSYDRFVEEQVRGEVKRAGSSRFVYQFADSNPYVGHPQPLKEGQDLFRRGLLSEAVLALEAEVLKNPDNSEGWRLLGITHAENDDDRQAIASMVRARDADPSNLEVLLALGVSHTNELEQEEALRYLTGWLQHHPKYGTLLSGDVAKGLNPSEVESLFQEAAQLSPLDSDVHTVLGVLYNLSRNFDKAISSFERALQLKPHDYSLWNKLGATQANSSRSAEAIYAYQQALDLKPNYVRAWSNMGIGYANQGRYEESVQYYLRALVMNPKADNAWQYLRISLSIASRHDLLDACEKRDLEALQKEFSL